MAEQRIDGAYMVETHFVDQLFEDQRIICEEVNTPLPVVESNGAGDDLPDFAGVTAAYEAVFVHLAGTLFDWQLIPVFVLATASVHGIEAGVTIGRDIGKEARVHRFFVTVKLALDFSLPLIGMGLDSLVV